jgi:two-component system, OmpR family, sensor histidine kinase KdpD
VNRRLAAALACVAAVSAVTGVIFALRSNVPVLSLGGLYVFAVLPIAIVWGLPYAFVVSVASMLAFNFFFLPPVHTFTLDDSRNWFALIVFVVTAVVVSELAARSRRRAIEAAAHAEAATALLEERERLAQEVLEAEALRRADVIKTALLRAVSHDLRTPLMAISTSAGALARRDLSIDDAGRAELLATILAASDRLEHLVGNLLDLSRLQAGAAQPEPEVRALDDLVFDAIEALGEEGRRVDVSFPDQSPAVRVDGQQIERVLVNLLENGLKYSPVSEPVHVHVTTSGPDALVRVVDRGPGIAPDERERIFEPFHRGSSTDAAGAGLGLAIARGFTEANGGRLWVESIEGQGAAFVLSLPAVRVGVPA